LVKKVVIKLYSGDMDR